MSLSRILAALTPLTASTSLALAAPSAAPETAPRSASRQGDLTRAETSYVMKSLAFSVAARRSALAFIRRQRPHVASMTPEEFLLCALAIPAFADNGHDVLNDSEGSWGPPARLPLRMSRSGHRQAVRRAAPRPAADRRDADRAHAGLCPCE